MLGRRLISCKVLSVIWISISVHVDYCYCQYIVRPSLENGSEVWEGNKSQAAALESVLLGGGKRILGCSSKTYNEAVRGDLGIDTLHAEP